MTESKWVKRFGPGEVIRGPYNDPEMMPSRCYYFDSSHTWLMVRFDPRRIAEGHSNSLVELFVSEVPICGTSNSTKALTQPMKTPKGVFIGLAESDFVKIMGKATRVDQLSVQTGKKAWLNDTIYGAKYGSRVLVYERGSDSNEIAGHYFSEGKLRSILFSNSE